ncbi:hypothetical protein CCR75_008761 [Bremia lactucae]|uniref:RxLR effector protein n=1 Tax=Bremia lactucae TaxID=4779 RepID=A0A976FLS6_BRELC|nr:hypothetical protein CCR75_008761 [Bremia lactucae]
MHLNHVVAIFLVGAVTCFTKTIEGSKRRGEIIRERLSYPVDVAIASRALRHTVASEVEDKGKEERALWEEIAECFLQAQLGRGNIYRSLHIAEKMQNLKEQLLEAFQNLKPSRMKYVKQQLLEIEANPALHNSRYEAWLTNDINPQEIFEARPGHDFESWLGYIKFYRLKGRDFSEDDMVVLLKKHNLIEEAAETFILMDREFFLRSVVRPMLAYMVTQTDVSDIVLKTWLGNRVHPNVVIKILFPGRFMNFDSDKLVYGLKYIQMFRKFFRKFSDDELSIMLVRAESNSKLLEKLEMLHDPSGNQYGINEVIEKGLVYVRMSVELDKFLLKGQLPDISALAQVELDAKDKFFRHWLRCVSIKFPSKPSSVEDLYALLMTHSQATNEKLTDIFNTLQDEYSMDEISRLLIIHMASTPAISMKVLKSWKLRGESPLRFKLPLGYDDEGKVFTEWFKYLSQYQFEHSLDVRTIYNKLLDWMPGSSEVDKTKEKALKQDQLRSKLQLVENIPETKDLVAKLLSQDPSVADHTVAA